MSTPSKTKRNNISTHARIKCFLEWLGDPKVSTNQKYANSNSKIKTN